MKVAIDHALDREWAYGLREAAVIPLPVSQNDEQFETQIARIDYKHYKLPWYRRYWTVVPWRLWNEACRFIERRKELKEARRLMSLQAEKRVGSGQGG